MLKFFSRFGKTLALILLLLGFSVSTVRAQSPSPTVLPVELDSLDDGPHFFGGRTLTLDQAYTGTVYAGGGEVKFTGTVDGDLVIFGASVVIDGSVLGDVYTAGGTVIVNGDIGGTLTAAAGELRIAKEGEVSGAVVGGARTYRQEGNVLGDVQFGAKDIVLSGMIGQNARFETDKLVIADLAIIGENLSAEVRRTASVSDQAEIGGEKSVTLQPQTNRQKKTTSLSWSANWLFSLIGRLVVVLIALALFGETIQKAGAVFNRRWPDALWKGAAFVVLVPLAILTLMLTVVGLPAAMLVGLFYILVLLTAWVVPAFWLGRLLVPKVSPYAQGAVGAVIATLVVSVPMLGWVVWLGLSVLGTGALLDLWRRR